jgi:hypothetical protein
MILPLTKPAFGGTDTIQWSITMNYLAKQFLSGKPVELTEASPEVVKLRRTLEGNCVFDDGTDVGGDVYWNNTRTVAVYVPSTGKTDTTN